MANATVTGASLSGIYGRLNGVGGYHPISASTFADWSMQAGDVVTVVRGEDSYQSPVHTTKMVWKGTPKIEINSTGNKEREAITKVSRKKYGRGSAQVNSEMEIYRQFTSSDGYLHSAIYASASVLRTEISNTASGMYSYVNQTAAGIRTDVSNTASQLQSNIDQQADRIGLVVEGTGSNAHIKAAQIAASINSQTGQSLVRISADVIDIDGVVLQLATRELACDFMTCAGVKAENDVTIVNDEGLEVGGHVMRLANAEVSGSNLILTYTDGSSTTFSKATSITGLTGSWSGSTLTVETDPSSGYTYTVGFSQYDDQHLTLLSNGTPTQNINFPRKLDVPLRVATVGTSVPYTPVTRYEETFTVNVPLETITVHENGTYSPSTGYVGFESVTVDISDTDFWYAGKASVTLNDPTANEKQALDSTRIFTVTTSGRTNSSGVVENLSKEVPLHLYAGEFSGNTATVYLKWGATAGSGGTNYAQVNVDASGVATAATYAGKASVTLNDPTANTKTSLDATRIFTVTTSGRTDASGTVANLSKEVPLHLYAGSFGSNNKATVYLKWGASEGSSGTNYAQISVDASDIVTSATYAGKASVTLNDPTANSKSTLDSTRIFTVTTSGRTNASGTADNLSKQVPLHLYSSGFSGTTATVYLKWGSSAGSGGTNYAEYSVDASDLVVDAGYAGKASVTLNDPTWNPVTGEIGASRTISVTTSGRTDASGTTANLTKSAALTLTTSGTTVYLQHSGTNVAKVTLPEATVTGEWQKNSSGYNINRWTATSNYGGSASVVPVHHILTGTSTTITIRIAETSGSGYIDHGGTKTVYLVADTTNKRIQLRSVNSTSGGETYGQIGAGTSTGIYDTNSNEVTGTKTISSSIDLWGGCKLNGSWVWGGKVTIKPASGPTYTSLGAVYVSERTQRSDGYHYVLLAAPGWQTPFGDVGNSLQVYKKN